jgi:hypothetical protein
VELKKRAVKPMARRAIRLPLPESASGLWIDYTYDVSVGLAYNYDTDPARLAALVSMLTASLCDDQSIAVYHLASRRLWKLDETVRARLAEGSDLFFNPMAGASLTGQ